MKHFKQLFINQIHRTSKHQVFPLFQEIRLRFSLRDPSEVTVPA